MVGWIISLIVLIVAVCAGLAALGFRGRITTVGIDLGTTFSVVGINKNGKVIIIEDSLGHKIFPSVVAYMDNGDILAGYDAVEKMSSFPNNTIYNAKRFIGRSLDDDEVRTYANDHPFQVVPLTLSNFSQVGFDVGRESVIAPEEVGAQVLKHLLRVTADYLGHSQVNKAVIAVPAKFNPKQRQATAEAYRQAGLKVIRVIEEPTAAAVAYKLHKKSNIHHILVYDFGGGTLDVSLLYVAEGSVEVYATDGDETLGGSDFDLCLYKQLKDKIKDEIEIDIEDFEIKSLTSQRKDINPDDYCSPAGVRQKAEEIKKSLTTSDSVPFKCFYPDSQESKVVSFSVEKSEYLEIGCQYLFDRAMLPVTRLLETLDMVKEDIDEVVLVGGSTRMPRVKELLREYFQRDLNDHIDPDVTVAYGAASILD